MGRSFDKTWDYYWRHPFQLLEIEGLNTSVRFLVTFAMTTALLMSVDGVAQVKVDASPSNGDVVDQLNGIPVYFNYPIGHSSGQNFAADGYYLGLRYQCVEFVKRYYYGRFKHRMPNARGNAVDYFDANTADGAFNSKRGLLQFHNGSQQGPQPEDILVFGARPGNPYGHIAIISSVGPDSLEIIQQNPGPSRRSRMTLSLSRLDSGITVQNPRVLGWLRLPARMPLPQPAPVPNAPPVMEIEPAPIPAPENLPETPDVPSEKAP